MLKAQDLVLIFRQTSPWKRCYRIRQLAFLMFLKRSVLLQYLCFQWCKGSIFHSFMFFSLCYSLPFSHSWFQYQNSPRFRTLPLWSRDCWCCQLGHLGSSRTQPPSSSSWDKAPSKHFTGWSQHYITLFTLRFHQYIFLEKRKTIFLLRLLLLLALTDTVHVVRDWKYKIAIDNVHCKV